MKLFCWIIDKSESSFSVDVANDETVDDLKEAIMKRTLMHLLVLTPINSAFGRLATFSTSSILCLTYPTQGFHQDNQRSQE
jgi:predicted NAD/FAD-binding protein